MCITGDALNVRRALWKRGCAKLNHWRRGSVRCASFVLLMSMNADSMNFLENLPKPAQCWQGDRVIYLKPGTNPHNMTPQVTLLVQIVSSVFSKHNYDCVVTRMYDWTPQQLTASLHNRDGVCRAADFRTAHLPEPIREIILGEIREALGYNDNAPRAFDFVFEPRLSNPDGSIAREQHFHGEYDPKFAVSKPAVHAT